jgi:exopolyphosphatase / guanosine-5'-triphosphate,3'-diphosphate pyrophosphatase
MKLNKAAIIDMGTNTFHLLLVNLREDGFDTIYKEKVAVKIGQGGINKNLITSDAQKRAFHTLKHFKNLIDGEKIDQIFAFATSAVRNAENGEDFVTQIKELTGIEVDIINGDQEAELIYEGVRLSNCLDENNHLIMDIGGGSVEFIIGNSTQALWKQSFEIGGQRLMDLFHKNDPILTIEIDAITDYLNKNLAPLIEAIVTFKPKGMIGASGTFDTLTDMYYAAISVLKSKKQSAFHLPSNEFKVLAKQLKEKTKQERLLIPGMIPMRVDMIVVSCCLIEYILKYIEVNELVCSSYALKEGAIAKLINQLPLPETLS